MNFKEKANKLVSRFRQLSPSSPCTGVGDGEAKQCALIAVDEMIKSSRETVKLYEGNGYVASDISPQPEDYWQEVKKEIEKL